MARYFLHLAYDGSNYKGWQIQPNGNTVQAELTRALSVMMRKDILITGAGRTDSGVHARNFYAHFDVKADYTQEQLDQFVYKLNRFLPADITVYRMFRVADDLHARFSAISRTYKYYISQNRDPFVRNYVWYRFGAVDVEAMNRAANVLLDITDFTSFSKLHTQTNTNNCKVIHAQWEQTANGLVFTITADRFLRNMVRAVVGTLLDVGLGKMSHDEFVAVIHSKDRCNAGESVPAQGLFLEDIGYPF